MEINTLRSLHIPARGCQLLYGCPPVAAWLLNYPSRWMQRSEATVIPAFLATLFKCVKVSVFGCQSIAKVLVATA
jgi:hypothetical protein